MCANNNSNIDLFFRRSSIRCQARGYRHRQLAITFIIQYHVYRSLQKPLHESWWLFRLAGRVQLILHTCLRDFFFVLLKVDHLSIWPLVSTTHTDSINYKVYALICRRLTLSIITIVIEDFNCHAYSQKRHIISGSTGVSVLTLNILCSKFTQFCWANEFVCVFGKKLNFSRLRNYYDVLFFFFSYFVWLHF